MMEADYRHRIKLSFVVQKDKDKGLDLSFTIIIK